MRDDPDFIQKHDNPSKKEVENKSNKSKKRQATYLILVFQPQPTRWILVNLRMLKESLMMIRLNPSNILKLLNSLITITESMGAILACALPWMKCLLLQHASRIMSQESSLKVLNSLFQLIESRVSSFNFVFQLSSLLDVLYVRVHYKEVDEVETVPIIYMDTNDSEDEDKTKEIVEVAKASMGQEQFQMGGLDFVKTTIARTISELVLLMPQKFHEMNAQYITRVKEGI
ncbi:unnamed protein product [Vicia faba]|uniref:Small-subunit processome Utp12 domain-containing protein n=1 Tax=Vicia faba TaxID=3906 RepID=A0AAV1A7M7_VICFA|nr:unnamed protein product [Vicia faba]